MGRYVDSQLMPGEEVKYLADLHWIIFVGPALVLVIAAILLATALWAYGLIVLFVAAIWFLARLILLKTSEFAVTNRRVIVKVGFIRRSTLELLLRKIEGIGVDQGIMGRILGYGAVVISGTGGSKDPYTRIANPLGFRRAALAEIEGVGAETESQHAPAA